MKGKSKKETIREAMLRADGLRIKFSKRHRMNLKDINMLIVEKEGFMYAPGKEAKKKMSLFLDAAANRGEEFVVYQRVNLCGQDFHTMRGGRKGRPELLIFIREIEPRHKDAGRRRLYLWVDTKYIELVKWEKSLCL